MKKDHVSILLVDDQPVIAEGIKRMLENEKDIELHYCQDPTKAIETAEKIHPTVILQDLVMPDIDGLLLVKYYKANPKTKQVPMIVLSVEEEPSVKAKAFSLGANDYLVKLPDKEELIARLRYHSLSYRRLLERNEAYRKLEESQSALQTELNDAAEYVKSQIPSPINSDRIQTSWRFIPSAQLGGDSFGYHLLDEDHLSFYLLDVCGHGVRPALLSCTINNLLRTNTLKQADFRNPKEVLLELNQRFQMEDHRNMFFTMWYGVYQFSTNRLTYASAGHPPALLYTKGAKLKELSTPGLVIGAMSDSKYHQDALEIKSGDRLFIYTDGVYELTRMTDNNFIEMEDFIQEVNRQCEKSQTIDEIIREIENFAIQINGSPPFPDDFSILGIEFIIN